MLSRTPYFKAITTRYALRYDQRKRIKNPTSERFGEFRVVHLRHSGWSRCGIWQRVFERLARDADNEHCMIDSTIVRTRQRSAGAKKRDLNHARRSVTAVAT